MCEDFAVNSQTPSRAIAQSLRYLYPTWHDPNKAIWIRETDSSMLVKVLSPCGTGGKDLEIEYGGREITLFFGKWHAHYEADDQCAWYFGQISGVVRVIDSLLEDRMLIVIAYCEGKWAGSFDVPMTSTFEVSASTRKKMTAHLLYLHADSFEVFSFSGVFNQGLTQFAR